MLSVRGNQKERLRHIWNSQISKGYSMTANKRIAAREARVLQDTAASQFMRRPAVAPCERARLSQMRV